MKFAANLSTLCQDIPNLSDRLEHIANRKDYSFKYVECQNPYSEDIERLKQLTEKHNFEWVLINTPPLFDASKDATDIKVSFREHCLEKAIRYATALKCSTIHLVMGDVDENRTPACLKDMTNVLLSAAQNLKSHGITGVIEPLSIRPHYYLRSYDQAVDIVMKLDQDNLKIMLDTFHLQKLHGNLTDFIERKIPSEAIGHVQVSQTPLRDCPMNPGEVNHVYILKKISKVYDGVIGLEYNSTSEESFSWLHDFEDI